MKYSGALIRNEGAPVASLYHTEARRTPPIHSTSRLSKTCSERCSRFVCPCSAWMSTTLAPSFWSAFGSAPATSPRPPVLAKGTASDERIATRRLFSDTAPPQEKRKNRTGLLRLG